MFSSPVLLVVQVSGGGMMKDKDASSHNKRPGAKGAQKNRPAAPIPIKARFQAVFENTRDAIGVSKAGVHLFVNPAYLELFGFPRGTSLAGTPVLDLIAPGSRDQVKAQILSRVRGEPAPSTYNYARPASG